MAGSKRAKIKKALSPQAPSPEPVADDGLLDDLLTQLDSRSETVREESATVIKEMNLEEQAAIIESSSSKQDSKSRHKARMARKAAALAETQSPDNPEQDAKLAKAAKDEEATIGRVCNSLDMKLYEIQPDGHCLYSAVADQLSLLSIIPSSQASYRTTRLAASNYIFSHPDDFLPFLPSASTQDGIGIMSPQEFEQYCAAIRDTSVWGGEPEILALSRAYRVPIHVVQSGKPHIVMHTPTGEADEADKHDKKVVRISYHRHMYGLGEHYNSLRPKSGLSQTLHNLLPDMS